jgi:hypothetical protein
MSDESKVTVAIRVGASVGTAMLIVIAVVALSTPADIQVTATLSAVVGWLLGYLTGGVR